MQNETHQNIHEIFKTRIEKFKQQATEIEKRFARISLVRFGIFVLGAIALYKGYQVNWIVALGVGLGFLILFGWVVKWNQRVNRSKRFAELQAEINQEELSRLEGAYDGFDAGAEFEDALHPYCSDLDLFGQASLFQLISHAVTENGRRKLAEWLKGFPGREAILERQQAVRELTEKLDWRQDFEAVGRMFEDSGESPRHLLNWLQTPPALKSTFKILPVYGVISSAIVITLSVLGILPWFSFFALVGLNMAILRPISKKYKGAYEISGNQARLLKSYGELLNRIESLEVYAPTLQKAKKPVIIGDRSASDTIKKLARIHDQLEMKYAQFVYVLLNAVVFWDIIWVMQLDTWKERNAEYVPKWFESMGEFEALSSLGALHFARPSWTFPEISNESLEIVGEEVGHPLIPEAERIQNNLSLQGKGTIWLITGSNMSGKSTFLRTVGINWVLGLAGGPVCATSFTCTPTQLFTSMRTQDSLEDHTSAFFAELKRLKQVIESVKSKPSVFFLLDEILKGTNSRDRHKGAKALILQLNQLGGSGMVSTHDLDLGKLESTGFLHNYSFNSGVTEDNQLSFDYKLTDGLCHSFNASKLMRNMGIEIEENPKEALPEGRTSV